MRWLIPTLMCMALAPWSARAEEGVTLAPESIADAAVGDWNGDGQPDLALLASTDPDDMMLGVFIYFREKDDEGVAPLRLALAAPDKVWGKSAMSGMEGQEPSIQALKNGSLAISSRNHAVGSERWTHKMTVSWRDNAFVVTGVTFKYWNINDPEVGEIDCDLNLLTGKGTLNRKPITFRPFSTTLAAWTTRNGEDPGIRICRGKGKP